MDPISGSPPSERQTCIRTPSRSANKRAEENVLTAIAPGPGASVKDSYATLDLARHGFDELFEARWITHDPSPAHSNWTVVQTAEELAEWTDAADLSNTLTPELLRHAKTSASSPPTTNTASAPARSRT